VLDLENPAVSAFLHDRQKTFQPRDLWEWLLKFAVLMFPLDVAVRRIQLDREEMQRTWRKVRGWILRSVPREPEAEESLAALLSRREQVRSTQTAPAKDPAELFRPQKPAAPVGPADATPPAGPGPGSPPPPATPGPGEEPPPPTSTTSRLLEAKRRAQRRKE
jgi:hypothetical protein